MMILIKPVIVVLKPVSYTHLDVYKRQAHPRQLGKIGGLVVKISSFKFKVQHIRGTQNVVADALSRIFYQPSEVQTEQPCSVLLDFPLAFTDVLPHQVNDEELGPIIQNIKAVSYTHLCNRLHECSF